MPQAAHPPQDKPFEHLSEGNEFCLVMVDMFSKWVEVFPTGKQDA